MSTEEIHPVARYETDMRTAKRRAALAIGALGLTVALHASRILAHVWQITLLHDIQDHKIPPHETLVLSDSLVQAGAVGLIVLLVVTGVLFLMWLHIAVRLTRSLGGAVLGWTPGEAVAGYFIPFVSFVRPYQVMRDMHDQLAPDLVPEPPMQVRAGEGYRDVQIDAPPPPARLPHASIGLWWGAFWVGRGLASLGNMAMSGGQGTTEALVSRDAGFIAYDVVSVASAILAVVVVRAVSARLVERYRRVRHNTPAALEDHGIYVIAA